MSVPAQRRLRSAISERRFDPVYLLHGDDDFRKDAAVAEMIVAATDDGTRDFNVDTLRGGDVDAPRLSLALNTLPMLAERRVVVLRDVSALKKAARAELDRYLGAPAAGTVLIMIAPAGTKADDTLAASAQSVPFSALSDDELPAWLTQRARKLGTELSAPAAAMLAAAVGNDLGHAAGELDKLASYTLGGPIDAAAVEAIVGVRHGETLGDLLDAVAARDAARAAPLVEPVLAQPKVSGVQVLMALTAQVLAMAWGATAVRGGLQASRLSAEYFTLLKSGRPSVGRPWGDAVRCWVRHGARWSAADLAYAVKRLIEAELALKDTGVSSDGDVLRSLVLALCVPSAARPAA